MLKILFKKQFLLVTLLGFSIVGCTNVDFVNRSSLKKMGLSKVSGSGSGKSFGAFSVTNNSSANTADNSRLIVVGKHNSRFVVETMIHDRMDDNNSLIKKSYVSAGAGSKKKGFMMQLRFEY